MTDVQASSIHAWHTVSTFQGRRGVLIANPKVVLQFIRIIMIDDEDDDDDDDARPTNALSCRRKVMRRRMRKTMRAEMKMMKMMKMVKMRGGSNATIFLQTHISRLRYLSQFTVKYFKRGFSS